MHGRLHTDSIADTNGDLPVRGSIREGEVGYRGDDNKKR